MTKNILLVGVGGQGTITASKLLTLGLLASGYDVKMSEIHGMSQRGGSVSSHVRYNDDGPVYSPVISRGEADILVSFEEMEALRWIDYLNPEGIVVVNKETIPGLKVLVGEQTYPEGILDQLSRTAKTMVVDGRTEAGKLGNSKVTNVILLGVIARYMKLEHIDWNKIIEENVKPQFAELNKKAFMVGYNLSIKA